MRIFVYASNEAGINGKGSALAAAQNHGALPGIGIGPNGNAYAIPTKDERLRTLPLSRIKVYVERFLRYAEGHPEHVFDCVAIGCGEAGYKAFEIAPMFEKRTGNVKLPQEFSDALRLRRPTL